MSPKYAYKIAQPKYAYELLGSKPLSYRGKSRLCNKYFQENPNIPLK